MHLSIDPLHKWRLNLNNNTDTSLASHSCENSFVLKHECEAKDVPSILIQISAPFMQRFYCNVKPEGAEGPRTYVGYLTSIALSTLGNLTKNLGPRLGTFAFLSGGIAPKHIVPCARLCTGRPWKTAGFFVFVFIFIQKHYFSLLIFNINWWNSLLCGDCW